MKVRSGDEPSHARSPLRARLGLAVFGLVTAVVAALLVRPVAPDWIALAFGVIAVVAAVDIVVVVRHLRQGPHYQPGRSIPPYHPVEARRSAPPSRPPVGERTRMRRYLVIMITCLVLITLAWTWVRTWSTTVAVVMSAIAAVLPPIAVIVANFGVELPPEPRADPRGEPPHRPTTPPTTPPDA